PGGNGQFSSILLVGIQLDSLVLNDRRLAGKRSSFFILSSELARGYFAGFYVRLIEAVDADYRSGDCGRNLPAEELLPEIVLVQHIDAHYRLSGLLESFHLCVLVGINAALQPDVYKQAILPIDLRNAELLAIDGDDAFSFFAGRFSQQLLEPRTQIGNARRSNQGDLVFARVAVHAQDDAQHRSRIFRNWDGLGAGMHHLFCRIEELLEIHAHHRGRNHAEIGKGRVAPANVRPSVEDVAELVALRHLLKRGARIGDGDKVISHFAFAHSLLHALEEVLLENIWLKRASRLA